MGIFWSENASQYVMNLLMIGSNEEPLQIIILTESSVHSSGMGLLSIEYVAA